MSFSYILNEKQCHLAVFPMKNMSFSCISYEKHVI